MKCQLIVCCILALQTKPKGDRDKNPDLHEDPGANSDDQGPDADALKAIHLHGPGLLQVHAGNAEPKWPEWGGVLDDDSYPLRGTEADNTCCIKTCDPGCPKPPNPSGTWSPRGSNQSSSTSPQLKLLSFTPENAKGENLNYCGEHFTCGPPLDSSILSDDSDLSYYITSYSDDIIQPASANFSVFLLECLLPMLTEHLKDRGGVLIDVGPVKNHLRSISKIKDKSIFPRQVQDYMRASMLVKSSDAAQDILTDILKMLVLKKDLCDSEEVKAKLPPDYGLEVVRVRDRLPRTLHNANKDNPGPLHNAAAIESYRDINLVVKDRTSLALAEIQLKVSIDFHVLGITHALYEMQSYLNTLKYQWGEDSEWTSSFDDFGNQLQTLQGDVFRVWYAAADAFVQNASNAELRVTDLLRKTALDKGLQQVLDGFFKEGSSLATKILNHIVDAKSKIPPELSSGALEKETAAALLATCLKFTSDSKTLQSYGEAILERTSRTDASGNSGLIELQVDTPKQTRAHQEDDVTMALWTAGDEQMYDWRQMNWRRLQLPADYRLKPITFFQVGLNRYDFSVCLPQATYESNRGRVALEVNFKWKSDPDIFPGHKRSLDFFTESFERAFMLSDDAIGKLASHIINSSQKDELQNFCCNSEVPVVVDLLGSTAMLVHRAEGEDADRMYQQLLQFFQSLAEKCCSSSNPPGDQPPGREPQDAARWGPHTSGGTRFKIIHSKPWFRSAFTSLATKIFSGYVSAGTYPLEGSIASSISSPRTELVVLADFTDPLRGGMSWITNKLEKMGIYRSELSMRSPAQRLMEILTGHWQNGTVEKGWMTNLASRPGVSSTRAKTNTASGSSLAEIDGVAENSITTKSTVKGQRLNSRQQLQVKVAVEQPKTATLIDHVPRDHAKSSDPEELAMGVAFQEYVEKDVRHMLSMCIKHVGGPLGGTYVLSDALMFMAMAWDFKPLQIIPKCDLEAAIKKCMEAQLGASCHNFEPNSCSSFSSVHSAGNAPEEPCACQVTLDKLEGSVESLKFGLCTDQQENQCNFGLISALTVFSELLHRFGDAANFIMLPNKQKGARYLSLGLQDLGFFLRYSGLYDFDGRHVREDITFKWLHAEDSLVNSGAAAGQ